MLFLSLSESFLSVCYHGGYVVRAAAGCSPILGLKFLHSSSGFWSVDIFPGIKRK